MNKLTRIVDREMKAARLEHNEAAELEELATHISFELNKVIKRQVELNMARTARENDDTDDDEQDAKDDDSDHIYDPYAFGDGH